MRLFAWKYQPHWHQSTCQPIVSIPSSKDSLGHFSLPIYGNWFDHAKHPKLSRLWAVQQGKHSHPSRAPLYIEVPRHWTVISTWWSRSWWSRLRTLRLRPTHCHVCHMLSCWRSFKMKCIIIWTVAHISKVSSRFHRTALLSIWASWSRNLHAGSPAQWPIAPQRMHLDPFFQSASFAWRCSIVRWERTNLPLPGLPFWPNLPLPLALPKATCQLQLNRITGLFLTCIFDIQQTVQCHCFVLINIIKVVIVILTSCLRLILNLTKKTSVGFSLIPSLFIMPVLIPMLLINVHPIGVGGVSWTWIRTLSRRRCILPLFSTRLSSQRRCRYRSCPGSWSFTKMYLSILFDKYLGDTFEGFRSCTCSDYQSLLSRSTRQFNQPFHPKWIRQLHRRV